MTSLFSSIVVSLFKTQNAGSKYHLSMKYADSFTIQIIAKSRRMCLSIHIQFDPLQKA